MPRQSLRKLRPKLFVEERNLVGTFITEKQTEPQENEDDKLCEEEVFDQVSITTLKLLQMVSPRTTQQSRTIL